MDNRYFSAEFFKSACLGAGIASGAGAMLFLILGPGPVVVAVSLLLMACVYLAVAALAGMDEALRPYDAANAGVIPEHALSHDDWIERTGGQLNLNRYLSAPAMMTDSTHPLFEDNYHSR